LSGAEPDFRRALATARRRIPAVLTGLVRR
jgi:hypothetical protein